MFFQKLVGSYSFVTICLLVNVVYILNTIFIHFFLPCFLDAFLEAFLDFESELDEDDEEELLLEEDDLHLFFLLFSALAVFSVFLVNWDESLPAFICDWVFAICNRPTSSATLDPSFNTLLSCTWDADILFWFPPIFPTLTVDAISSSSLSRTFEAFFGSLF